jgi:hypothetical protein
MGVIGTIFFFICLSFLIVIFGIFFLIAHLRNRMLGVKVSQKEEAFYVNDDFDVIGRDAQPETIDADEIIDTTYEVVSVEKTDSENQ